MAQPTGQLRSTRSGNGTRRPLKRCPSGEIHRLARPLPLRFSDGARRSVTPCPTLALAVRRAGLHGASRRTSTLARSTGLSTPCPTLARWLCDALGDSTGPAGEPRRARSPPGPASPVRRVRARWLSDALGSTGRSRRASTLARSTGPSFPCPTLARAGCPTRWGLHGPHRRARRSHAPPGPASPVRRARTLAVRRVGLHGARRGASTLALSTGPQLPLSDVRARWLSDARGLHGAPQASLDARALHGPSRPAWTREGSTDLAGEPRRAPCLSHARALPTRQASLEVRGIHRPSFTCPTWEPCPEAGRASRAPQANLDARALGGVVVDPGVGP
jgi:hypothetical protein